jgi:hypothetical protein
MSGPVGPVSARHAAREEFVENFLAIGREEVAAGRLAMRWLEERFTVKTAMAPRREERQPRSGVRTTLNKPLNGQLFDPIISFQIYCHFTNLHFSRLIVVAGPCPG